MGKISIVMLKKSVSKFKNIMVALLPPYIGYKLFKISIIVLNNCIRYLSCWAKSLKIQGWKVSVIRIQHSWKQKNLTSKASKEFNKQKNLVMSKKFCNCLKRIKNVKYWSECTPKISYTV